MLCFTLFILGLTAPIHGILPPHAATTVDSDISKTLEANLAQGHTTLNDMLMEVEQLMEDTQQKLEDAVHQVT